MNAPALCPECLRKNVVATATGPTCTHNSRAGNWWPAGWQTMHEPERVRFLEDLNALNT